MVFPQAYHITFGVYLARPPGSQKPHVDHDHNEYGEPLAPTNQGREDWAREHATDEPVELTIEQRIVVEEAIRDLAKRYGWIIHAIAVQRDHVHVVISAARKGDELREAIKAVASRWLNQKFRKRKWWAEGGSAKYLWERPYFKNAVDYVNDQRDF
jgi:REP element-mobilizing transposase RayT